jgi:2-(1,2-epoxy-1,2-dihydrophenyl)acetyl-CoA isomerase
MAAQTDRLITSMTTIQTPIVSSVRGWAVGLGLQLVLAADFAVAANDARLWEPFAARGFTPDSGATWLLPRRVGEVVARQMLILGRELSGEEAARCGLVHQSVPPEELDSAVEALVGRLAGGPTVSLGLTKWLLHAGASATLERHLRDEAFGMELSSRSEDFREGMKALVEKRGPDFRGR